MGSGASTLSQEELKESLSQEELSKLDVVRKAWNAVDGAGLRPQQKAAVLQFLQEKLRSSLRKYCPSPVKVTVVQAFGLQSADLFSSSDPYVVIAVNQETKQTKVVKNNNAPVWNESFEFIDPGACEGDLVSFFVLDKDFLSQDDPLGTASFQLQHQSGTGSGRSNLLLENGKGSLVVEATFLEDPVAEILGKLETFEHVLVACDLALDKIAVKKKELATQLLREICDKLDSLHKEVEDHSVLVRKEIRTLTEEERKRYCEALKLMMQPEALREQRRTGASESKLEDGQDLESFAETSEFFQLASIHGWPKAFCTHREENFPIWHRLYLLEFEHALSNADKELGNDGNLPLPYWDFTKYQVNDQVIPDIYKTELATLPPHFFKADRRGIQINELGYRLNPDAKVKAMLEKNQTKEHMYECLEEPIHWRHASSENTSGRPIEDPHNTAHMVAGFPLSNLGIASFHPLFFNLHCNIDRFYQTYLDLEPDSLEEFQSWQTTREKEGKVNKFEELLKPFSKGTSPDGTDYFAVKDVLFKSTSELGYVYDALPLPRPPQLREPPVSVLFEQVDVVRNLEAKDGSMKSFELHLFLLPKAHQTRWEPPTWDTTDHNIPDQQVNEDGQVVWKYAGWVTALGAKGKSCKNCQTTKPVNLHLEVTNVLRQLGIGKEEAVVKVVTVDERGQLCPFEKLQETFGETIKLPQPLLVGPRFTNLEKPLEQGSTGPQVDTLHNFLVKYGFLFDEPSAGKPFDASTASAVSKFQSFHGLTPTGTVDTSTWTAIALQRNDHLPDTAESTMQDECNFPPGKPITYQIQSIPGYLNKNAVYAEVRHALDMWQESGAPIHFVLEEDSDQPVDLVIAWKDRSGDNDFPFDGPGGTIAHTTSHGVELDINERWILAQQDGLQTDMNRRLTTFSLLPVLLHEVGHFLGLRSHSPSIQDVMSPYYVSNRQALSPGDMQRIKAVYDL